MLGGGFGWFLLQVFVVFVSVFVAVERKFKALSDMVQSVFFLKQLEGRRQVTFCLKTMVSI